MTTVPSIRTVSSISRMASTAAPSAASFSPSPTQRAAAMAPYSVTRTSSIARLRSGREPLGSGIAEYLENAGRLARTAVPRLTHEAPDEDHRGARHPHEVPGFERDLHRAASARPAEDDPVDEDQGRRDHPDDHRDLARRPAERRLAHDQVGEN